MNDFLTDTRIRIKLEYQDLYTTFDGQIGIVVGQETYQPTAIRRVLVKVGNREYWLRGEHLEII